MTPKEIAQSIANKKGWTGPEWQALVKLWGNESGWQVGRLNKESLACGIVQAWPCSKLYGLTDQHIRDTLVSRNGNWYIRDADTRKELEWGANYIEKRYGKPSDALAFWYANSPHWY